VSDATDRTAALAQLLEYAQAGVVPILTTTATTGEVDVILDRNKRASTWVAATAYTFGQIVQPTTRNGHKYRCIVGGTSGSTEPSWLKGQGLTLSDGSSSPALTWEENGPEFSNVYDIRQAAYECWNLKLGKASQFADVGSVKFSQIVDNCTKMRDSFAPLGVS
jgi:hypothetical protein